MSSSQVMYRQLKTYFFLGTPNLYRNITQLVPNVHRTLYTALRAVYCTNIIFSLCIMLAYNAPVAVHAAPENYNFLLKEVSAFTSSRSRQVECTNHKKHGTSGI